MNGAFAGFSSADLTTRLTQPSGVPLGHRTALALGGAQIASRVAVVAGQDDFGHPALREQLQPDVAVMVDAAWADPAGFEYQVARTSDAHGLWQLVLTMSSARDRKLYSSGGLGDAYLQSLEEGFSRGAAGYARDLITVLRPWPVAPEQVLVPVDLWFGQLDTSPVHSPDLGATLATRLPAATRRQQPPALRISTLSTRGPGVSWSDPMAPPPGPYLI